MLAAVLTVLMVTASSFGQAASPAMGEVPGKSLIVFHVKNMTDLSQKVASWSKNLGITPDQAPPTADMLGFATGQLKITKGLKLDGDLAVAMIDNGQGFNGPNPPVVILFPVTSYADFIGNFPDAKTNGAVTTAVLGGSPSFIANWGNYAAVAPSQDLVATAPAAGELTVTPAAQKELDAKDVVVLVNMAEVRALALPIIAAQRGMALTQLTQGIRQTPFAKYTPVLKVAFNEIADLAVSVLTDCNDVTLGVNLGTDGISSTMLVDFAPDSHFGKLLAAGKNTDKSLLAGLPQGKYLALGGNISDPEEASALMSEYLDPVQAELTKLGGDGQMANDYISAIRDAVRAKTGGASALVVPEGELGTSPLMQVINVATGDAKTLQAASAKILQTQTTQLKGLGAGSPAQSTFTLGAKTLDGVVFDQYHVGFDMTALGPAAQVPQVAKIGQIMTFVYGQDGMNIYSGAVSDNVFLSVGGLTDDKISAAIAAAKSMDDPMGKQPGIVSTASHLPAQREAVFYLPVDVLVNTAFSYVAKFGIDMGVTMPASDPIGFTIGTDGSAARLDGYIPSQTVVGVADIVKKLRGGGAGGPAAGPGGAL
jgi:hypothetical protein